jgi:hypothetical protein
MQEFQVASISAVSPLAQKHPSFNAFQAISKLKISGDLLRRWPC